jgi:asparagine synthetase A
MARFIHKEADISELKNHLEQKGYKNLQLFRGHFSLIIQRNNDGVSSRLQSSAVVCRGQHAFSVKEA